MQYYPIYLNITNKRCIVVGGGEVGERKAERLLECGAHVVVIGRALTPLLEKMKEEGRIDHIDADYDDAYLEQASVVIGATNRDDVNKRISGDAGKRGILVNIVDDPARCDFILPSLVKRGDLVIAVSTGGRSPALAKKLREDMEASFGPEYETFLEIMGNLRKVAIAGGCSPEDNKKMFELLVKSDILRLIRENNREGIRICIRDITGLDVELIGI